MITIAIINQKGGTGKTTTAVNLAAALARKGHETLLIDLDPQAHATVSLGLDPEKFSGRTIGEALIAERPGVAAVTADTYLKHLKIVPASIHLSRIASLLHSQNFREQRLWHALEDAKGYDYRLIDCQPTLEVLPVNAMVAADHFLIPTQPAGYGLRGLTDLLETLHTIKRQGAQGRREEWDWRILLTMVMGQATGTNELVKQILNPIRDHVLETVIHRNERLNRAQTEERPRDIFAFDKQSRGAKDYEALVKEVVKIWPAR
jgi:chromosome partitioning protein